MRSASCHQNHQQTPTHPQPHPSQQLQTALCQPAAANAAAIYTATVAMHTSITALRSYYNQQQQQQPTARGAAATGAMGSGVASPPSVCDLCALVVGVSRLVQMEYGALHGQGECHLRDQVSKGFDSPDKQSYHRLIASNFAWLHMKLQHLTHRFVSPRSSAFGKSSLHPIALQCLWPCH